MSLLRIDDAAADVGGRPLLSRIGFEVPHGELHVLLGPSGSGKTTLLRAIAGLHPLTAGRVQVGDRRVDGLAPERRRIVLMHQEDALFPHLDVAGNVAFPLRLKRLPGGRRHEEVQRLLRLVGLDSFGARRVQTLSGGERQRVALARALAAEPEVLLLDEPLSALDRQLRHAVRADLRRILREAGITALFVTHDREEAFALGDRLLLLEEGRLIGAGPPQTLFRAPPSADAARALGRRNVFAADPAATRLATTILGPLPRGTGSGDRPWIVLNEEDIRLRGGGPAIVANVEFQGTATLYEVRHGGRALFAEARGPPQHAIGDAVTPEWDADAPRIVDAPARSLQS